MTDADRNLGARWFEEVWNQRRREAIAEMLAPHALIHDGDVATSGVDGFYEFFDRMHATFSDLRITVHDTIAEGDKLCVRWSCQAKHTGHGLRNSPTGKAVSTTGISIIRIAGGKIVEGWQNWDMLGLMQQIQGGGPAPTYITSPA